MKVPCKWWQKPCGFWQADMKEEKEEKTREESVPARNPSFIGNSKVWFSLNVYTLWKGFHMFSCWVALADKAYREVYNWSVYEVAWTKSLHGKWNSYLLVQAISFCEEFSSHSQILILLFPSTRYLALSLS